MNVSLARTDRELERQAPLNAPCTFGYLDILDVNVKTDTQLFVPSSEQEMPFNKEESDQ